MLETLKNYWMESFAHSIYKIARKLLFSSVFYQFFTRPDLITERWYESFLYGVLTYPVIWLKRRLPKTNIPYSTVYISIFIVLSSAAYHEYWNEAYTITVFAFIAVLFIMNKPDIREGADFFLILFVIFLFLSVMNSSPTASGFGLFANMLVSIGFALLIYYSARKMEDFRNIFAGFYISLLISSMFVLLGAGNFAAGFSMFDKVISAIMGNSENYAQYLIMFFPLSLGYVLIQESKIRRFIYGMCLLPTVAVIALTKSNPGYLGFLFAVFIFIVMVNWRFIPIFVVTGGLVYFLMPEAMLNRIFVFISLNNTPNENQANIIKGLTAIVEKYWYTGIGLGPDTFLNIYSDYAASDIKSISGAHILYLQILLEVGFLGMFAFLWYIVGLIKNGFIFAFQMPNERKILTASAISALFGISVISLFRQTWDYPRIMLFYWILAGVAGALIRLHRKETAELANSSVKKN